MNHPEQLLKLADELARLRLRVENLERLEPPVVAAQYTTNAGQSIPNVTHTIVNFEDNVFDTHDAVTTGASWKFTAPVGGLYVVRAIVRFSSSTTWGESELAELNVFKNGSSHRNLHWHTGLDTSGGARQMSVGGTQIAKLAAGDYVDVRVFHSSGASLSLDTSANYNNVSIWKL